MRGEVRRPAIPTACSGSSQPPTLPVMTCTRCQGTRWTCEEHPDKPMGHDGCKGAGDPCPDCNDAGGDLPDIRGAFDTVDAVAPGVKLPRGTYLGTRDGPPPRAKPSISVSVRCAALGLTCATSPPCWITKARFRIRPRINRNEHRNLMALCWLVQEIVDYRQLVLRTLPDMVERHVVELLLLEQDVMVTEPDLRVVQLVPASARLEASAARASAKRVTSSPLALLRRHRRIDPRDHHGLTQDLTLRSSLLHPNTDDTAIAGSHHCWPTPGSDLSPNRVRRPACDALSPHQGAHAHH